MTAQPLVPPILLDGWAGQPRWWLIGGLTLLGASLAGLAAFRLSRSLGRRLTALLVGLAVVAGGSGALLVVADQDFATDTPDRPCAAGPWTATWTGSHDVFAALPESGDRGGFAIELVRPPGNGTPGPWGGRPAWTWATITSIEWQPPTRLAGNWSEAEVSLNAPFDEPGPSLSVEVRGEGERETPRRIANATLGNVTRAAEATIGEWTEEGSDVEEAYRRLQVTWRLPNATLDPSPLVQRIDEASWQLLGEPRHPLRAYYEWSGQGPASGIEAVPDATYRSGEWTIAIRSAVKAAEGEIDGTAVQFTATAIGTFALQTETHVPDEDWPALAEDVYAALELGDPPDRAWDPEPGAVC